MADRRHERRVQVNAVGIGQESESRSPQRQQEEAISGRVTQSFRGSAGRQSEASRADSEDEAEHDVHKSVPPGEITETDGDAPSDDEADENRPEDD